MPLADEVRDNAKAVYTLIAEAESRVHGHPIENIHFHEVGSLDALADVLSVCELMHELAPDKVLASSVNVGSGFVKCTHGVLPVLRVEYVAYGTGKKNFETANVVRVLLGETKGECEQIIELACNLDDMTPEELGFAMEELFRLGALDVYFTSIGMKKPSLSTWLFDLRTLITYYYFSARSFIAACAAARRAMGTRKGLQET